MEALQALIEKGGYIMYPILFCSLLSLTVVLERLFALTTFQGSAFKIARYGTDLYSVKK